MGGTHTFRGICRSFQGEQAFARDKDSIDAPCTQQTDHRRFCNQGRVGIDEWAQIVDDIRFGAGGQRQQQRCLHSGLFLGVNLGADGAFQFRCVAQCQPPSDLASNLRMRMGDEPLGQFALGYVETGCEQVEGVQNLVGTLTGQTRAQDLLHFRIVET